MHKLFTDDDINKDIKSKFEEEHCVITSDTDCWISMNLYRNNGGYGSFYHPILGKHSSHRAAYLIYNGFIPKDYVIDHLCRNRACGNPEHLEAVPPSVNILRGEAILKSKESRAKITCCPKGHLYTEENTRISTQNGYDKRNCRECDKIRAKLTYNRKKNAS